VAVIGEVERVPAAVQRRRQSGSEESIGNAETIENVENYRATL
jgi:hypothetical protein